MQDHRGNQLYLGINHCGILTFQGSRKTHHFRWVEVQKINYEGKMFIVHLTFNEVRNSTAAKDSLLFLWPSLQSVSYGDEDRLQVYEEVKCRVKYMDLREMI